MADKVQRVLEDMVPELLDLGRRKVFTKDEIKEIIFNRRSFEYRISSRTPIIKDYLDYLNYEYELERIRYLRTRNLGLKKRTIGDYSIIRLIHFIFKRALRRFPSDEKLWLQNIDFCLKSGSSKALQRNLIAALRNNPTKSVFWLLMSDRELQNGNLREARSSILLGLRTNKESLLLWRGFAQLEINVAYKQYLSSFKSEELSLKNSKAVHPSVTSLLPIVQFGQKKLKSKYKKEAFIVYMFRQYHKLKTAISKDTSDIYAIRGMRELEREIISSINRLKYRQPLFSVFSIILELINVGNESRSVLEVLKNEMELVMGNEDIVQTLLALLLICRLVYNCVSASNELALQEGGEESSGASEDEVFDFGFQITDSINFSDSCENSEAEKNHSQSAKQEHEFNVSTWYSHTCLDNIIFSNSNYFKDISELVRVEPNLWNTCFLENNDVDYLTSMLSRKRGSAEISVSNREICKDSLISIDVFCDLKSKIKNSFSSVSGVSEMSVVVEDILGRINGTQISEDFLALKLSLFEAFESLFSKNNHSTLANSMENNDQEKELSQELQNGMKMEHDANINEQVSMVVRRIKSYIGKTNSLKIRESDEIVFIINSVNKLLDLILHQVEIHEQRSLFLFDFNGFTKCIYWIYLSLNYNLSSANSELKSMIVAATERIVNVSLCKVTNWIELRSIPSYVFNVVLMHSIVQNIGCIGKKELLYDTIIGCLNRNIERLDSEFDHLCLIETLKKGDYVNGEIILGTIKSLFDISKRHDWVFSDDINVAFKINRDLTIIAFKIVCITLLNISLEKHILSKLNDGKMDPSLSYDDYFSSKIFFFWESLTKSCESVKDITGEFYSSIVINHLLFLKLIEYLKLKRYLPPDFGNKDNCIKCPMDLIGVLKRKNPEILTKKLHLGFNLNTLIPISPSDPKFILFLNIQDNVADQKKDVLELVIASLLDTKGLVNSVLDLIKNNHQ